MIWNEVSFDNFRDAGLKGYDFSQGASSGRSMRYVRSMHESEDGESDGSGVKVQKMNLQPGRGRNANR